MEVNLSTLSTPQLLAIRRILTDGATAFASTETAELKNLREYKARSELLNQRRELLADIGIDINEDQDYWIGLDNQTFQFVVQKLITVAHSRAEAENKSIRIPRLITSKPESAYEIALAGLRERAKHNG
jgi:hypothetical protein